jgi:hypothetical protein
MVFIVIVVVDRRRRGVLTKGSVDDEVPAKSSDFPPNLRHFWRESGLGLPAKTHVLDTYRDTQAQHLVASAAIDDLAPQTIIMAMRIG